jgi:transposase
MRKTREILRLVWALGHTQRDAKQSLRVGLGTVCETLKRAKAAGLDWHAVSELDEAVLEARLYPRTKGVEATRPKPDPLHIHLERKRPGVTLELLHQEYLAEHSDGYQYTQFCEAYRAWLRKRSPVMRQEHVAGEKAFLDFSGKKPHLVDARTGECVEVELFVAVLGASNLTYAEATATQQVGDWIAANEHALLYFRGVPAMLVPDQLKSAVTHPCRYEPEVQRTYEEFAQHYGTAIVPARPRKPRDKAKVEVGVQVAQRWLLARMRNEVHPTLASMNARLGELLDELNRRVMRGYGMSRRDLYERLDRPALRPLPADRFELAEWKLAKVNIDYHVEFDHHYYSVPFACLHEQVEVRATAGTVEVFLHRARIALHARSRVHGTHTTVREHMPKAHQAQSEWSPARLCTWASKTGPSTESLVRAILADRPHPEQGYRSCLGILRLAREYGPERLEAACARAFDANARSYRHVAAILKNGLDRIAAPPADGRDEDAPHPAHANVRGSTYYR